MAPIKTHTAISAMHGEYKPLSVGPAIMVSANNHNQETTGNTTALYAPAYNRTIGGWKGFLEVKNLDNGIDFLIKERNKIAELAIRIFEPEIAAVCHLFEIGEQVSEKTVESLFDRLLQHCYNDDVVKMFNALCQAAETQHPHFVRANVEMVAHSKVNAII